MKETEVKEEEKKGFWETFLEVLSKTWKWIVAVVLLILGIKAVQDDQDKKDAKKDAKDKKKDIKEDKKEIEKDVEEVKEKEKEISQDIKDIKDKTDKDKSDTDISQILPDLSKE